MSRGIMKREKFTDCRQNSFTASTMYPRPFLLSKMYRPAFVREICRRSRPRSLSSVARPYTFHIGASWAGKPKGGALLHAPWPADGLIGAWRDHTLARSHTPKARDAGEDFFFIQEVRPTLHLSNPWTSSSGAHAPPS